jgi:hypothetical protein
MDCPICRADVDLTNLRIEDNEGEMEIGFTCVGCGSELYAILGSADFVVVN